MKYLLGEIEIDSVQFSLRKDDELLSVEPKVFDLIIYLIENRNKVLSRDKLFKHVWDNQEVSDTTLSNHIKLARRVLGDSGEQQSVIKTVRGRGYQLIAHIEELSEDNSQFASTNPKTTRAQPKQPLFQERIYQAVILGMALALILVFAYTPDNSDSASTSRIAVLPFENLRPASDSDYLGFAIADQIIGELSSNHQLTVRASAQVRQYQQHIPQLADLRNSLEVDYILMGTYLKESDQVRLNVELINLENNQLVWRKAIAEKFSNAFKLQDMVTQHVTEQLNIGLGAATRYPTEIPSSPLAYEYFLRAIAYPDTNQGATMAIEMLKKAQALDPDYAPIYVKLGGRTNFLATFGLGNKAQIKQAINHYEHALKLNPNSESAITGLATLYTETGKINNAVKLSRQLIKLNPHNAQAHFSLGYTYRYAGMLDESIAQFKRAIEIDPQDRWSHNLGVSYFFKQNYSEALKALKVGKATPYSMGWIASNYILLGKNEEAIRLLDQIIEVEPGSFWELDSIGFKSVVTKDLKAGLAAAKKLEAANIHDGEAVFYWAGLYAMLGDKEGALRLLKQSLEKGYFNYPLLENLPFFSSVRKEPEFLSIYQKVKEKHLAFKMEFFTQ